jgi:hypothetical protein
MQPIRLEASWVWPFVLVVLAMPADRAAADATAFRSHCTKCHPRESSLMRGLKGDTGAERAAALSKFLETHHARDPEARAAIVDYLVGLSGK